MATLSKHEVALRVFCQPYIAPLEVMIGCKIDELADSRILPYRNEMVDRFCEAGRVKGSFAEKPWSFRKGESGRQTKEQRQRRPFNPTATKT